MILYSPAKVNLYIDVLGRRPDGYHNILTIFERISLFDKIIVKETADGKINLKSNCRQMPLDSRNLIYKTAALLKEDFKIAKGLKIEIQKNIPPAAGLGGGSSNAASVLSGLNVLWNLKLPKNRLFDYGNRIGSDVAFFLSGESFACGTQRGQKIKGIALRRKLWHVLAVPDVEVMTARIYSEFDKGGKRDSGLPCLTQAGLIKEFKKSISGILFNRLEGVAFRLYPEVKKIKEALIRAGLKDVLMSGSGGGVFGIVSSRKEGLRRAKVIGKIKGMRVFVARTL